MAYHSFESNRWEQQIQRAAVEINDQVAMLLTDTTDPEFARARLAAIVQYANRGLEVLTESRESYRKQS